MSAELFAAIKNGDQATVEDLLDQDPHLAEASDETGVSAVLTAFYHRQPDIAQVLIAEHPGLNVFEAAAAGDADRIREILDRSRIGRGDPSLARAYSADGFHPLGLAAFFRRADVVRLLLERGVDVAARARNKLAVTALHSAVATDAAPVDREIVRMLLEAGAPVNVPHLGGGTPLHTAAYVGDPEVVRMLLERGGDPSMRTDDGKTAIDIARERGHTVVAEMLSTGTG